MQCKNQQPTYLGIVVALSLLLPPVHIINSATTVTVMARGGIRDWERGRPASLMIISEGWTAQKWKLENLHHAPSHARGGLDEVGAM